MDNPYLPVPVTIEEIRDEVVGARATKTFKVVFQDEKDSFVHKSGQCLMVSIPGKGECFFAISSSPTQKGYLEFSVMKMGKVTSALHEHEVGDTLAVRGPYGNGFPVEDWQGKNLVFIGGGIGQAPVRSVLNYVMDNREKYGDAIIISGARTVTDICFKDELFELEKRDDVETMLSIDWKFGKDGMMDEEAEEGWHKIDMKDPENTQYPSGTTRFTGFVPQIVLVRKPSPESTIALTCGPPIMIKFVVENLLKLDFTPDQIYTTLEMRMKCGIGKCGRCNIGSLYVCKDGPVFTHQQLMDVEGER
jgi:NAD(P)H-flavin reductase